MGPNLVELGWKDWLRLDITMVPGGADGDIAAAVAVLRMLQSTFDQTTAPIKMIYNITDKVLRVLATEPIKANELRFPPCLQKLKVLENSTHPRRVTIPVMRTKPASQPSGDAAVAADAFTYVTIKQKPCKSKREHPAAVAAEKDENDTKDAVVGVSENESYIHPELKMP